MPYRDPFNDIKKFRERVKIGADRLIDNYGETDAANVAKEIRTIHINAVAGVLGNLSSKGLYRCEQRKNGCVYKAPKQTSQSPVSSLSPYRSELSADLRVS